MRLKVCAVTTWPPHRDGVALYSAQLYKQVAKFVDVEVVANIPKLQGLAKSCEKEFGAVLRCWRRGPLYPLLIFRSVFRTRAHVVHLQHGWLLYSGLIASMFFPILLSFFRLSRRPCVVTMHTVIRRKAHIYANPLFNFLAQMAVLFLSRVIVKLSQKVIVHNHLMKRVLQTGYISEGKKIVVIPHGVKKATRKPEFSQKSEKISILSLGFLRKGKGIRYLIEAFKKVNEKCPDAELLIVGESHAHDKKAYLEDFKHTLTPDIQKQVLFTGFVDETSLEKLIWGSDIIVLQSTEPYYIEASGALAAVADYGKPVVCSNVPKFQTELQNGENCVFVTPSDSTALTQALVLLIKNNKLRKCLGKNLKERSNSRDWSAVAEEHVNLYRCLVET